LVEENTRYYPAGSVFYREPVNMVGGGAVVYLEFHVPVLPENPVVHFDSPRMKATSRRIRLAPMINTQFSCP
jgi:hypothetical protein